MKIIKNKSPKRIQFLVGQHIKSTKKDYLNFIEFELFTTIYLDFRFKNGFSKYVYDNQDIKTVDTKTLL